jgi:hypothetical protein
LVLSIELIFDQLRPDVLVCGTSWGMTIDKIMTLITKKRGILSISMIDHWTLFRQRYCDTDKSDYKDDLKYLTDYCIVIDEKARILAEKEGIESARLLVGGHPHLEALESQCINLTRRVEKNSRKNILFISERIRDDIGRFGRVNYDEYCVLDDLCIIAKKLNMSVDIKLHPQEEKGKIL